VDHLRREGEMVWIQMKRILEFVTMSLVILLCGCTSEERIDRINSLPSDDKINDQYSHVSDSAPESLKPYYDAQLTRDLNK